MRWACDHPECDVTDDLDHLRDIIRECGWAVQAVEHPPWSYTVGLTAYGRPELVLTGLPVRRSQNLLNATARRLGHVDVPVAGQQFQLRGGPLMEVVDVVDPAAHLVMAVELFGPDIRALQLVHADDRGDWPWQHGFRGDQPVLGARAPQLVRDCYPEIK